MLLRSPILLLVAGLAAATAPASSGATSGSEEGEPPPSTTVEILVEAQTPSGRSPLGLAPGDFAVTEDGLETEVIAVEPLDEGSGRDAQRRARVALGRRPWTVLVYVDTLLLSEVSLASLAGALAGEASELTALGAVEVVVAAPEPRIHLGPTRDPKLVRDALEGLAHLESVDGGNGPTSVVSLRRRFLDLGLAPQLRRLEPEEWDLEQTRAAVVDAAGRESALVRRQLETLRWWLRSYPPRPPKLLVFMTDGLDVELTPFYLAGVPGGGLRRQLERDLLLHELATDVEETATAAGALAWTVLPLWRRSVRAAIAPGPDPTVVQESSLLVAPSRALGEIAELTAGDVVGPLDLDRTLIELNRRVVVTYRAPRASDAALHRIEVASARLRLRTPPWRSTPVELPPTAVALRGLGGDQSGGLDAECSLRDEGTEETLPGALRLSCDLRVSATAQKKGAGAPRALRLTVFAEEEGGGRERIDRRVTVEDGAASGPLRLETALPPRLRGRSLIVVLTGEDGEGGFAVERLAPLASLFTFDETGTGLDVALPAMPGAKPVYLTPFDDPMVAGPVLVEALVTRPEVVRVEFLLDGRQVASAERSPFEAWLRLDPLPEPHVISAVARGAAGDELGRDEMRINQGLGRHRVHIERPTSLGAGGLEEIEIAVEAPASMPAQRVDLYWNEDLLLRFAHPPFRARLELPFAFEGDYLRAVAHFADGSTDEDTLLKTRRAFSMKTDVEMIELYTVVKDASGRPVTDLRPEEISIFEEGRRQELRKLERAEDVPLRLALTIDISESMQPRMDVVKRAAQEFADTLLGPRDQSLLAAFNHRPFLLQGPTGDPEILGRDIERLPVVGGTSLHDAVIFSLLQLRELPGRKAVVLLTDGKDKHSRFTLNQALDFARQSSIPLYLIGPVVEEPLALEETTALRRMAALTGGALYLIRSERQLPAVYAEIAEELRHQYVLAFQSDYDGRSSEWRSLEVRISRPGVRARTMTGYFPHRRR